MKDVTIDLSGLSPRMRREVCYAIKQSLRREVRDIERDLSLWLEAGSDPLSKSFKEMEGWHNAGKNLLKVVAEIEN